MTTERVQEKLQAALDSLEELGREAESASSRKARAEVWHRIDEVKRQVQEYRRWLDWEAAVPR